MKYKKSTNYISEKGIRLYESIELLSKEFIHYLVIFHHVILRIYFQIKHLIPLIFTFFTSKYGQVDTAARDKQIKIINDLQDYISQQTTYLTEFDESLMRRWIKQITIWDDPITVELKSGVNIDVDA